jgi:hypothetical protein
MPLPPSLRYASVLLLATFSVAHGQGTVQVAPAAAGEPLSAQFQVGVEGQNVPVYLAPISSLTAEQRRTLRLVDLKTTTTSFASFDMTGPVHVTVTSAEPITRIVVLPDNCGVTPQISGKTVTFTLSEPKKLTLEVNGNWINSLHLFANAPEPAPPKEGDPNVIYFGPGIHNVESIPVTSGQTVYLADGAILYGHATTGNLHTPILDLHGSDIVLRGRGIIDGALCPRGTRSTVGVVGSRIKVEGVIIRNSPGFNLPVRRSDDVTIDNVKVFGWRQNSDGMDICNSRRVTVHDCFLRTFDDLIVLKTDLGQGELRDVTVTHCILWNEFAHALSLGAELREPLTNMTFSDCDIIHDKGREWLLRIYNCDSAPVKNVVFDHIRIEEARRLMSVWIGKAVWSREDERGHVDGVTFQNIESVQPEVAAPYADLVGFDPTHLVQNIQFQNILIAGKPLEKAKIHQNAYVTGVTLNR